jgi:hypothetical protein
MTPAPPPSQPKHALGTVFVRVAAACAVVLSGILAAAAGSATASTWTLRQLAPIPNSENEPVQIGLSGISCPSESFCVAVGGREGTLAFSGEPTGGSASWHEVKLEYPVGPGKTCVEGEPDCEPPSGALQAVSCASQSLCALTTYDGWIFVSSDPTGGSSAWLPVNVNGKGQKGATHLTSISCPSPSFCAAVSGGYKNPNGGRVLTSTNPISGQWQTTQLVSQLDLRSISCGTPSFCVAAARGGRLFASTDPIGGAPAWKEVTTPAGSGDLEGASCVSTVLCAVGNMTGNLLTTENPSAGAGATWSEANAGGSVQVTGVSCPTAGACLAVDNNGDVTTSTDPAGGASAWHFENLIPFKPEGQPHNALFGASCASTSLCALVAGEGRIFTSTDPFSNPVTGRRRRRAPRRPKTFLVLAENFWNINSTRHRRLRARFHFYSPTRTTGFECRRDRGPYRRCRSPLRYWVKHGHHMLHVRAIGPTGLRGPAAMKRFCVFRRSPRKLSDERGCGVRLKPVKPGHHEVIVSPPPATSAEQRSTGGPCSTEGERSCR